MGHAALALLAIALSGYTFLSKFILTKYRIYKYQGHHLVYKCFSFGLAFLLLSACIFILFWPLTNNWSFMFSLSTVVSPNISQSEFNFYSILLMTLLLSYISAKISNKFLFFIYHFAVNTVEARKRTGKQVALYSAKLNDDAEKDTELFSREKTDQDFDLFAYHSSTDNKYISHILIALREPHMLMLTLGSGKCYVCIPYGFDTPRDNEEQKEVVIIPVASGYRHGDDHCFEITTYYSEVIKLLRQDKQQLTAEQLKQSKKTMSSYRLTIALSQIVSIASFDISKYLQFKESENSRRNEIKQGRGETAKDEKVINP